MFTSSALVQLWARYIKKANTQGNKYQIYPIYENVFIKCWTVGTTTQHLAGCIFMPCSLFLRKGGAIMKWKTYLKQYVE